MPALAPRVLKDANDTNRTYDVSTFNGSKAVFVDNSTETRFANRSILSEQTRPTAAGNDGHKLSVSLALPHPVEDQDGCCVDKDTPPSSYVAINTMLSKFATGANADDLIALTRSYVASPAFAALVKGGNNW